MNFCQRCHHITEDRLCFPRHTMGVPGRPWAKCITFTSGFCSEVTLVTSPCATFISLEVPVAYHNWKHTHLLGKGFRSTAVSSRSLHCKKGNGCCLGAFGQYGSPVPGTGEPAAKVHLKECGSVNLHLYSDCPGKSGQNFSHRKSCQAHDVRLWISSFGWFVFFFRVCRSRIVL